MQIPALPPLEWTNGPSGASYDSSTGELRLSAVPGGDWTNDPLGGPHQHGASMLGFRVDGDFTLSARVRVLGDRTTFDAAVIGLWCDEQYWAKLCYEYSPDGRAMVVSVVTTEFSDDCKLDNRRERLRVSQSGSRGTGLRLSRIRRWRTVGLRPPVPPEIRASRVGRLPIAGAVRRGLRFAVRPDPLRRECPCGPARRLLSESARGNRSCTASHPFT